jgi:hypothetical protein
MAMALQYAKKLDFVDIINRDVAWDKKQCKVSPGQLALSVVLSTFADVRSPLYQCYGTEKLFFDLDQKRNEGKSKIYD